MIHKRLDVPLMGHMNNEDYFFLIKRYPPISIRGDDHLCNNATTTQSRQKVRFSRKKLLD